MCVGANFPREGECIRAIESPVSGMPSRGKRVNSSAKTIFYNVYILRERARRVSTEELTHKTAEATGYGKRTV